jgi:hypothetical protein
MKLDSLFKFGFELFDIFAGARVAIESGFQAAGRAKEAVGNVGSDFQARQLELTVFYFGVKIPQDQFRRQVAYFREGFLEVADACALFKLERESQVASTCFQNLYREHSHQRNRILKSRKFDAFG